MTYRVQYFIYPPPSPPSVSLPQAFEQDRLYTSMLQRFDKKVNIHLIVSCQVECVSRFFLLHLLNCALFK